MRVIAIAFALLTLVSSPCLGATIYVDQAGGGDFLTIGEGIHEAGDGDTVLVAPGVYHACVSLRKNIALVSESGPEVTIIEGPCSYRILWIRYDGDGSRVSGFTFRNTGDVCVQASGADDIVVSGNIMDGGFNGITASGSARITVTGNIVETSDHDGIYLHGCTGTVERNEIHACGSNGIFLEWNGGIPSVCDNIVYDNQEHGILMESDMPDTSSVFQNVAYDNGQAGICVTAVRASVTGNIAFGNTYGIYCTNTSGNDVSCNTTAFNEMYGVYFVNCSSVAHHNIAVANPAGIVCTGSPTPFFSCNDVWGNTYGNYLGDCPDPTGTDGNISVDPCFCEDSYMLGEPSPCAPDNSPEGCGLIGALGIGCGECGYPVPVVPTPWGHVKSLFR